MKFLLDANTVSDLFNEQAQQHQAIWSKVASLQDDDEVYVSVLTLYEFEYGYANAPEEKKPLLRKRIDGTLVSGDKEFKTLASLRSDFKHEDWTKH